MAESLVIPRRAILLTAGAAVVYSVAHPPVASARGVTFYVSAGGDDGADGQSPETAWATIGRLQSELKLGSSVVFRRGDTFFGELMLPKDCKVGAFGRGDLPTISTYKLLNRAEGWEEHSSGIWRIDLADPSTHGGFTASGDANIGHLLVDGLIKPAKKKALAELVSAWDFWSDELNNFLYVAAATNPTRLAADIRAAPRGNLSGIFECNGGGNTIQDLHLTGSGGHGIIGSGSNVQISGCQVDNIGGSFLPGYRDGLVRYGNGIETGIGARDWLVEKNELSQIYDAAYTCQGTARHEADSWQDLTIQDNFIHESTQSFEFWSRGSGASGGFRRISVVNNHCERAGYSVFSDVRPNQAVRVHLLTYNWDLPAEITLENNLFSDAYSAYSFHTTAPIGLKSQHNRIKLRPATKMQFQRDETISQSSAWQKATGRESGSSLTLLT